MPEGQPVVIESDPTRRRRRHVPGGVSVTASVLVYWRAACLGMVFSLGLVLTGVAMPAAAAPGTTEDTVDVNLSLTGSAGTTTGSIPVLPGLTPVALSTTITGGTGPAAAAGTYTLSVGTASAQVDSRTGGAVNLALPAGTGRNGSIEISLSASIVDAAGCPYDTDAVARVSLVTVSYLGTPTAPTSLADFFSPALKTIAVVADPGTTEFTAPAILQATSTLASAYSRVELATVAPTEPDPYARIVRFVPTAGQVSTKVDTAAPVATLVISGEPTVLVTAAAALGSDNLSLGAGSPDAQNLREQGTPPDSLTLTWGDVGNDSPSLIGHGLMEESVNVSQARFGGPISALAITVIGTHTPTAPNANTTASLLVNGKLLASTRLLDNDSFTLSGLLASNAIQRSNTVTLQVETVTFGSNCRSTTVPARVDINADGSTFVATPGQSLQPGFGRFPQVLNHKLPVSFATGPNPADLANAANIVAALSRLDSVAPAVSVIAPSQFIDSNQAGLMVGAGSEQSTALQAPLRFEPWRTLTATPTEFTVTVDSPFAALEGFTNGERDVLLLGAFPASSPARAAALQTELASKVVLLPDGWSKLSGDLFVNAGGGKPVQLDSNPPSSTTTATESSDTPWLAIGLSLAVAVILVLLLAGAWWLFHQRTRTSESKSGAADPDSGRS